MTTNQMEKLMTPDQIVERLERAITQEYDLCAYEDEVLALCAAYRELADLLAVTADAMKGYIEDLEGHGACLNYGRSILLRIAAQALPPQEGK